MSKFIRKSQKVEAIQLKESNFDEVHDFIGHSQKMKRLKNYFANEVSMRNNAPDGIIFRIQNGENLALKKSNWVVKDDTGFIFPVTDFYFKSNFEPCS